MKVYNRKKGGVPPGAVYIGRPSKWGNPYGIGSEFSPVFKVSTREEAVESYYHYLKGNPELLEAAKKELVGKDLVCWCKPLLCHGDAIKKILVEEGLEEE